VKPGEHDGAPVEPGGGFEQGEGVFEPDRHLRNP